MTSPAGRLRRGWGAVPPAGLVLLGIVSVQVGAAFAVRAVLAATLSPTWGVYAGYELCENVPVRPGSEEYLDSEKYQLRPRDWAGAEAEGRSQ